MFKAEEKKMKQALKKAGREVPELIVLDSMRTDCNPGTLYMEYVCWTNKALTDFYLYVFENPVRADGYFSPLSEQESTECLHFMSLKKLSDYIASKKHFEPVLLKARQALIQKNYNELSEKIEIHDQKSHQQIKDDKSAFKI
jgi:hypothetical protein